MADVLALVVSLVALGLALWANVEGRKAARKWRQAAEGWERAATRWRAVADRRGRRLAGCDASCTVDCGSCKGAGLS